MANRGIPASIGRQTVKGKAKRKPVHGAIRIVTHGVMNEQDACCVWLWTAFDETNNIVGSDSGVRGVGYGLTNNSAMFHAVVEALGWLAVNMPDKPVRVLCDVEVIVKLVNGQTDTRKSHLKLLRQTAKQFLSRTKATLEWRHGARSERAALPSRRVSRKEFSEVERTNHDRI